MSTRSSEERAASRAEARRRARLASRGELPAEEASEPDTAESTSSGGGFLRRIFPPAPPLPNKPDPLAGFEGSGPLRPIRERVHLLRQSPWTWIGFGFIAFLGFLSTLFWANSGLELVGTFVLFGALIAAGWFGWQRPTLYGTAAGILGFAITTAFVYYQLSIRGVALGELSDPGLVTGRLVVDGLYQAALGFLGGWYGGYLRRRQTQLSAEVRRRR
jgi:hypothetical protein